MLRNLGRIQNLPWMVFGDFNEILYSNEKKDGIPREERRMNNFRHALESCSLVDMGILGSWFTWQRGNSQDTNIRERLDRCVANEDWFDLYPSYLVKHLPHNFSDHCPLFVKIDFNRTKNPPRPMRFESWWVLEESCEEKIRQLRNSGSGSVPERLLQLLEGMRTWEKQIRVKRRGLAESLSKELEFLSHQDNDDESLVRMMDVKLSLNLKMDKEETFWEQRARVNWLKNGDQNTAFFHKFASQR